MEYSWESEFARAALQTIRRERKSRLQSFRCPPRSNKTEHGACSAVRRRHLRAASRCSLLAAARLTYGESSVRDPSEHRARV